MQHILCKVVIERQYEGSKRQSLAMLRSSGQQSQPKEDRSQRLIVHRLAKVKLHQGVGPPLQYTAAGGVCRLAPSHTRLS
jgi:hypothetical protein